MGNSCMGADICTGTTGHYQDIMKYPPSLAGMNSGAEMDITLQEA